MEVFDSLAKTYGVALAILIAGIIGLARVCRSLYAENSFLHGHIEQLLEQRSSALQSILDGSKNHPPQNP